MLIDASVGTGAQNLPADVNRIRELLDLAGYGNDTADRFVGMPGFGTSAGGDIGAAVRSFERSALRSRHPHGRIDPGSLAESMLVARARLRAWTGERACRGHRDPRITAVMIAPNPTVVRKVERADLISERTIAALEMLGHCCGLDRLVITEGLRTYERMATYFLDGTTQGGKGVRGESWRFAKRILDEHNGGKPWPRRSIPAQHVTDLTAHMRALCARAGGARVSNHVVTEEQYRTLNVIDLGFNSNPLLQQHRRAILFAHLLDAFHVRNSKASHGFVRTYHPPHRLNPVLADSLLGVELSVENAWHLEILPARVPPEIA